jgi:hypothetical protein
MRLYQAFSEWIENTKDAFGFGRKFPNALAALRRQSKLDLAGLGQLLGEAQESCRQKDELIAKLQANEAFRANMVSDESAYYIRKEDFLDGPFCMACFQRDHKMCRITTAPKPREAKEGSADWVQCLKCRTPFQSERLTRYLNPAQTTPAQTPVSPEGTAQPDPVKASPKPGPRTRRPKKSPSEQPESAPAQTPWLATSPGRSSTTSPVTSTKDATSLPTPAKSSRNSPPC